MLRTQLKKKIRSQRMTASASYQAKRAEQRRALRMYGVMRGMSGTTQQAIRTGGWADPSRMGLGELKFVDTQPTFGPAAGALTFQTPGVSNLINGIVPGSSASQRIGRKVVLKSILIRYTWALAPTSTGGSPLRILVVYDKQANAAAPGVTDILLANEFNSQNNLSNRDRFVTIFDHITEPIAAGETYSVSGTLFKKLNLETMFNAGTAGTIGDITSGSMYITFAQNGNILTASPAATTSIRVRYTDV